MLSSLFPSSRRVLACLIALSSACAQAESWPGEDWSSQLAAPSTAISALDSYAFPVRDEATRKGVRTDALLVIRDGQVVYERYAEPTSAATPHLGWSMAKSILATTMGVAYGQGLFKLDAPVADYYPPFSAHPQIKVGHLLNWASGLDWQEDYEYAPLKSSVVAMLYTRGRSDMAAFTAAHTADAEPGARFRYSSGDTNVLSAALKGMVGEAAYADYPWTALFNPLGIKSAVWETDAAGTFVGSSYLYMTARGLARVGLLMQRNESVPGGQWWLNVSVAGARKPWPAAPSNTLVASGHWGQGLYVLPDEKLVIVRYADDRDGSFDRNHFLKLVLAATATEVQP